ncbi:hypothetical protein H0H81_011442 [Sphagnurus paluster]|uniref:Uncharacterized protein n=1 Tax=Sphagnurus paluster TaxID=117069 RepID=A0A9P7GQS1_9AGAR|nr:hypothetical protein H0H81_011442 [Sphagnurus paluster]
MSTIISNIVVPLIWLPIAPLITVSDITIGHTILQNAHPQSPAWSPPLAYTVSAGAIGGTILGVPLVPLFIYLLFIRASQRLQKHRLAHPEDGSVDCCRPLNSFTSPLEWAACAAIIFAGAPAAGALGVACLPESSKVLSPGRAAIAGVVGGGVIWGCIFGFMVLLLAAFAAWMNVRAYRIRKENERYLAQRDSLSSGSPRSSDSATFK